MSSCYGGAVDVVGGVALLSAGTAVAAVYGAGWLLYQSGNLIYQLGKGLENAVAEREERLAREMEDRERRAVNEVERIVATGRTLLAKLNDCRSNLSAASTDVNMLTRIQDIHTRLQIVIDAPLQLSLEVLEVQNLKNMAALERLAREVCEIERTCGTAGGAIAFGVNAASDLLSDLAGMFEKSYVSDTICGENVQAIAPAAVKRKRLQEELCDRILRIQNALQTEAERFRRFPVAKGDSEYLHSLFDGIDKRVDALCANDCSIENLEKGVHRLGQMLEQYSFFSSALERKEAEFTTLYGVYAEAQRGLGGHVKHSYEFLDVDELKKTLEGIKAKIDRAQLCADIYKKLGHDAYLCYAVEEELRALGYKVFSGSGFEKKLGKKLQPLSIDGIQTSICEMANGKTQLFQFSPCCNVQLIVRPDGQMTMETIMDGNNERRTVQDQIRHCGQRELLQKRLRENWFVDYSVEELTPPQHITTAAGWRGRTNVRYTGEQEHRAERTAEYQG